MEILWRILIVLLVVGSFALGAVLAPLRSRTERLENNLRDITKLVEEQKGPGGVSPWVRINELEKKIKNLQVADRELLGTIGGWDRGLRRLAGDVNEVKGFEDRVFTLIRNQCDVQTKSTNERISAFREELNRNTDDLRRELMIEDGKLKDEYKIRDESIRKWVDKLRVQGRFSADVAPTPGPLGP